MEGTSYSNIKRLWGNVKITYNVLRAGDRNPVLRLRQGYGACTLLQAGVLSLSVDSFMLLILKLL